MNWKHIDLWIVAAYLLLMLGIAFWHYRFSRKSLENFFLGGRKVPGWMNGISYTAALVSPDAATGYGGLAVASGAFISWWYLGRFSLALFLGGVLFAVFWRRLNLFTSLEFYDLRFKPRTASAMRLCSMTDLCMRLGCVVIWRRYAFSRLRSLRLSSCRNSFREPRKMVSWNRLLAA